MKHSNTGDLFNIGKILTNDDSKKNRIIPNIHIIQCSTYLLDQMGYKTDGYRFNWSEDGPFSNTLFNDILSFNKFKIPKSIKKISKEEKIIELKKYCEEYSGTSYDLRLWLKALASIHYLENVALLENDEAILDKIETDLKLTDECANRKALVLSKNIRK